MIAAPILGSKVSIDNGSKKRREVFQKPSGTEANASASSDGVLPTDSIFSGLRGDTLDMQVSVDPEIPSPAHAELNSSHPLQ